MKTKFLSTAILLGAISAPTALPQEKSAPRQGVQIETGDSRNVHVEHTSREGTRRMVHKSSENGHEVEVELNIKGVIFNNDYTDIESIKPGGFFELRETRSGVRRKIDIEPDATGQLKYAYAVQGSQKSFDAEARGWLAQVLKERIEHGFDARERVARIYKERGASGVVEAARSVKTSYARSTYLQYLLKLDKPGGETLKAILQSTARDKFSDYERSNLLSELARQHLSGTGARADFFESVKRIESDYYRSQVLMPILKRNDLDERWTLDAVKTVAATSSDYEKSRVLLVASRAHPENEKVRAAIIDIASSIGSEYYRNSVLAAVARARKTTSSEL